MTLSLLERTLDSLFAQTNPEFRVILVSPFALPQLSVNARLLVSVVDLPEPAPTPGTLAADREARRLDKGRKYQHGITLSAEYSPRWVCFFDIDDLVHQKLVEFMAAQEHADIWHISKGYIVDESANVLLPIVNNFHRLCGTSHIYNYELIAKCFSESSSNKDLRILGSHILIDDFFRKHQTIFAQVPFPGAAYMINHGQNVQLGWGWKRTLLGIAKMAPRSLFPALIQKRMLSAEELECFGFRSLQFNVG